MITEHKQSEMLCMPICHYNPTKSSQTQQTQQTQAMFFIVLPFGPLFAFSPIPLSFRPAVRCSAWSGPSNNPGTVPYPAGSVTPLLLFARSIRLHALSFHGLVITCCRSNHSVVKNNASVTRGECVLAAKSLREPSPGPPFIVSCPGAGHQQHPTSWSRLLPISRVNQTAMQSSVSRGFGRLYF